jgi:aquaporin Z
VKRGLAEGLGSFLVVLTFGCTLVIVTQGAIPSLAIGAAMAIAVYLATPISGGQVNPAVTLGAWLAGRQPARQAALYWIAQLAGALLAVGATRYLKGPGEPPSPGPPGPVLVGEFLFTFVLVLVALSARAAPEGAGGAVAADGAQSSVPALAVGAAAMTGSFALGNVSLGALNPAAAVGLVMMGVIPWAGLWAYLVAELAGAAAAALAWRAWHPRKT